MNLNDDVVYRRLRLGPLHQLHPGRSRSLIRYHDRLHGNCLLGHLSLASTSSSPVPQIRATVVGCWHPTSSNASPEQHPSGKAVSERVRPRRLALITSQRQVSQQLTDGTISIERSR